MNAAGSCDPEKLVVLGYGELCAKAKVCCACCAALGHPRMCNLKLPKYKIKNAKKPKKSNLSNKTGDNGNAMFSKKVRIS